MKSLYLLLVIGSVLLAPARVAFTQNSEPDASTPRAVQSQELAENLRSSTVLPSPAGIYAAGSWRSGLTLGMANVDGLTYTTIGGVAGYHLIDGLEVGANVRGWLSSAPTILEITPEIRYVAWRMPGFKPYAGAFYRWNQSRDAVAPDSYGGRLGLLYNKSNSRLYMGAGAVWEQMAECRAAGRSDCSVVYPELFFSAGPISAVATRAPLGLRP